MTIEAGANPDTRPLAEISGETAPAATEPGGWTVAGSSDAPSLLQASIAESPDAGSARVTSPIESILKQVRGLYGSGNRAQMAAALSRAIAKIDRMLAEQVNVILHHPQFQRLEAAYRGLQLLVQQAGVEEDSATRDGVGSEIKIRVLSISKREALRDFEGAVEFDQSELFRKIYDEEFGMPGGQPYGVLLSDYEFTNHPDDVYLLAHLSEVSAAAFAPCLAAASPALLGLDRFGDLERPINLQANFQQVEYLKWRALREREDSRFLGLLLPRILMRLPYEDGVRQFGFHFVEDVSGPDLERYSWGSPVYAFGSLIIRAFATSGWFADLRGAERGVEAGGLVTGLPAQEFGTDAPGVALKMSTELAVSEERESELSDLGFIAACHCQDTFYSAFFSNQSIQKPKQFSDPAATTNAKMSAMLQYMLCAGRFAHYLKVMVRDKIGGGIPEKELELQLNNWLTSYVTDEHASPEIKAQFPLREGRVEVSDIQEKPGSYKMIMHLLPHFQLDQLTVALKLATKLTSSPPI